MDEPLRRLRAASMQASQLPWTNGWLRVPCGWGQAQPLAHRPLISRQA